MEGDNVDGCSVVGCSVEGGEEGDAGDDDTIVVVKVTGDDVVEGDTVGENVVGTTPLEDNVEGVVEEDVVGENVVG